MALQQSNEEVLRVWGNWKKRAPVNLIDNEATTMLLADFVAKNYGGVVSYAALDAAVEVLGDRVLVPELTKEQKADKIQAKMQRDFQESLQPNTVQGVSERNAQREAADKKAADEKELKSLISRIEQEINNHVKGHMSGAMDYAGTESERDSLRLVRDIHDRRTIAGAKLALAAVQIAKRKL